MVGDVLLEIAIMYADCWAIAKVKLPKLEKAIDHYEPEYIMNEKVVSLHEYRQNMDME